MDILVTRRLTLRPPLEVDADAIFEGISNPNVARNIANLPHPYEPHHAMEWIKERQSKSDRSVFTIYRERLIGAVEVHPASGEKNAMLGYWLAEPHWNNGFITEAARAAVSHAFRKFDLQTINCNALVDNIGSLRVMDKLGFEDVRAGTMFNAIRNEEGPNTHKELKRSTFERLFGPLDPAQAA